VDVIVTNDPDTCLKADGLVVPGVGAFAACMEGIRDVRGDQIIGRRLAGSQPVLGICVGMQVLFTTGDEHGVESEGLGEWPGRVERLHAPVLPHMGWNTVQPDPGSQLFAGLADERFYFVHSYAALHWELPDASDRLATHVTWSDYHGPFIAAVENGPLSATQFHPEKSGDAGAALIKNWIDTL
jgi:imidazole glycerol-phosphate synthase subunit HisH